MALRAGSPAIDTGDDSVLGSPLFLTTDQRGAEFPRKSGLHVDIGAFEQAFDACLKDNSTGNLLQWNGTTGAYTFTRCSDGFTLSGTGAARLVNGIRTLTPDGVTVYGWKALAGSVIGYSMDRFDILIVGFMLASISADLGLTSAQAGALVTWTLMGAVGGGLIFGFIKRRAIPSHKKSLNMPIAQDPGCVCWARALKDQAPAARTSGG